MEDILASNHELTSCNVKLTINLDQLSDNLSPSVKKAVESCGLNKLVKQFSFFAPQNYRSQDNKDVSRDTESIATLTTELEDWMTEWYGGITTPDYRVELVQHAVTFVRQTCPSYSVTSLKFRAFCLCYMLVAYVDDIADKGPSESQDDYAVNKKVEYLELCNAALIDDAYDNAEENQSLERMEMLAINNPIFRDDPHVLILGESLRDVFNLVLQIRPDATELDLMDFLRNDVIRTFQGYKWTIIHSMEGNEDAYSLDTYRHFKSREALLTGVVSIISMFEKFEFRQILKINPLFVRWFDLGKYLTSSLNDMLGLEKDLVRGEEDSVIFVKLRKGIPLEEVVDQELQLLGEYVEDYKKLRELLIKDFGHKDKELLRYIDFVDAIIHGHFHVFQDSVKYGMKENIQVDSL